MDVYKASVIIVWALSMLTFLLATLLLKSKKDNWGRFWMIWFSTLVITGIIVAIFVTAPDWVVHQFELIFPVNSTI